MESGKREWIKVEIHLDNLDNLDSLVRTVMFSLSSMPAYPYVDAGSAKARAVPERHPVSLRPRPIELDDGSEIVAETDRDETRSAIDAVEQAKHAGAMVQSHDHGDVAVRWRGKSDFRCVII